MAGRTASDAVANFLAPVRQSVNCVTDRVVQVKGGWHPVRDGDPWHEAGLHDDGAGVQIGPDVRLYIIMAYDVIRPSRRDLGRWKVTTKGYKIHLTDAEHRELLLAHWHPDGASPYRAPHLHVGREGEHRLAHAHIPSGRLTIEAMILFAIDALGAEPRRDDYLKVLRDNLDRTQTWRTWHIWDLKNGLGRR